ncbi:hypothetical protein GCM10023210_07270 [Chryseobacterium ginsengisoli]|uniref:DUF4595 domain-containing protein n=1 Tax=Chryseobacterium ginsengisoli TaxID=363853 RepID=A0ABP9LUW7_9FLAO
MKPNKHISLLLIISSLFIISCQTDDTLESEPQNNVQNFESYHYMYMHYPNNILLSNTNGIIRIEYDNQNRPIKRIGGMAALPASTGFGYIFSGTYAEEITYENNDISLFVKSTDPNIYPDRLKTIFKTENGKIIRRVEVNVNYPNANDTINYFYSNDRLVRSFRKKIFPVSESKYYYNSAGNVDSIVARPLNYDAVTQTWTVDNITNYRTVQTFSNYDSSLNPTKKLMLFEEIFNRSLSNNNYRSYESKSYDFNGSVLESSTRNWTFNYVNNQIIFGN